MRVASGKRLSGHDVGRSDYVETQVRVYSLVGVIVASSAIRFQGGSSGRKAPPGRRGTSLHPGMVGDGRAVGEPSKIP